MCRMTLLWHGRVWGLPSLQSFAISVFDTFPAMARRPRVFAPGLLYHVIVRGNQRRKTFRCDDDYKAYLDSLEHYRAKFHLRI
jgi:hypothetical protein